MVSESAAKRRERSQAILAEQGVPFIQHLPTVEDEDAGLVRSVDEVAKRAMALCIVACKGEGLEQSRALQIVEEYGLESALSPNEHAFVFDPNPSHRDKLQFLWQYECYWVMLWALNYVQDLPTPAEICDVQTSVQIMVDRSADEFIQNGNIRETGEILDALDLTYRYDWACVDSRLEGAAIPDWLNCGVVMERHRALNWLVGYPDGADWDDVTMDT